MNRITIGADHAGYRAGYQKAIEGELPAATPHDCNLPPTRRLACGHCPHEVCEDCDRCPHTCRCGAPEGKDTREGESTLTLSVRDVRTTVLVAVARALREQPTGARILDGLDELGEASVCEDLGGIAAWADALAAVAGIDDALGAAAAQPLVVYRAEHETIPLGTYTTEAVARQHAEDEQSLSYGPEHTVLFDWIGDEEDEDPEQPWELVVQVDGGDPQHTGYVVIPITVASTYDPDAE